MKSKCFYPGLSFFFYILIFFLSWFFRLSAQNEHPFKFNVEQKEIPCNHLEKYSADDNFNFAIVSDRTGGMRRGIFEKAIEKLNLLQPDFVMSIGDLIDGYSLNEKFVIGQWEEFDSIIQGLEVPFFRLSGNHDVSNEMMKKLWKVRYGKSYYHFIYRNVLFLCLDTENPVFAHISPTQIDYFSDVLTKNKNVRWTFVFMHVPLWQYGKKGGFGKIENLLKDRKYTVFSGHHHYYYKAEKNGNTYITMATTGGGSAMRGPHFGEFDHIAWVTMKENKPVIANIDIDGIRDENVITQETEAMVKALRTGSWFNIKPVVHPSEYFKQIQTSVILTNTAREPLKINGLLPSVPDLYFSLNEINITLAAGEKKELPLIITSKTDHSLSTLPEININLKATYFPENSPKLSEKKTCRLIVDWIHTCPAVKNQIVIDGDLSEWENIDMINVDCPLYVRESWNWKGSDDGMFTFTTRHDEEYIYVAIITKDDKMIHSFKDIEDLQDKLYVNVSGILNDAALLEASQLEGYINIIVIPGQFENLSPKPEAKSLKIQCECRTDKNGIIAEIAIPRDYFKMNKLRNSAFRLNMGFMDHDMENNTNPSVLWWKPVWGSKQDYNGSGIFYLEK